MPKNQIIKARDAHNESQRNTNAQFKSSLREDVVVSISCPATLPKSAKLALKNRLEQILGKCISCFRSIRRRQKPINS